MGEEKPHHRLTEAKGLPEIEPQEAAEVVEELGSQGSIETELTAQRIDLRRLGAVSQHDLHRIAWNQMDEREDQGTDDERQREGLRQPPQRVADHRGESMAT
jgi:hypothetical protein